MNKENLSEYLKRTLSYWDVWGLINNCAAPYHEYDTYVNKVLEICEQNDFNNLELKLRNIFSLQGMPSSYLDRSINGIAESIRFYYEITKVK